ncbi:MAG: RsmD family RNA methyltransferase [Bacteriovoracaceae bacterium]
MKNIWHYSQPDFYKFNEDSIQLTKYIIENSNKKFSNTLDLCAGSGVLGIELLSHNKTSACDFLELQPIFINYILKNISLLECCDLNYNLFLGSMGEFLEKHSEKFKHKYDLIVANPPFFNYEQNKISENNIERNFCRFFFKDNYTIFFNFIANALRPNGECYFVAREMEPSPLPLEQIKNFSGSSLFKLTTGKPL